MKKAILSAVLIFTMLILTVSCAPRQESPRTIENAEQAGSIVSGAINGFFSAGSVQYDSYYHITASSDYYKALIETNASVKTKRTGDGIIYSQYMKAKYYEDLNKSTLFTETADNSFFDGTSLYNNYNNTCLKYDGSLYNPVDTIFKSDPGAYTLDFDEYACDYDENGGVKIIAKLSLEAVKFLYASADPGLGDYGFSLSSVWNDMSVIDYSAWVSADKNNALAGYGVSITVFSEDDLGNTNLIEAQMHVSVVKTEGVEPELPPNAALYADDSLRGVFSGVITNEFGNFIFDYEGAYQSFADTFGETEARAQSKYFSDYYGVDIKYLCKISHSLFGDYGAITGEYPGLYEDARAAYGEDTVSEVLEALGFGNTDLMMMGIVLRDLFTPDGKDLASNFSEIYNSLCEEYGSERVSSALDTVIQ